MSFPILNNTSSLFSVLSNPDSPPFPLLSSSQLEILTNFFSLPIDWHFGWSKTYQRPYYYKKQTNTSPQLSQWVLPERSSGIINYNQVSVEQSEDLDSDIEDLIHQMKRLGLPLGPPVLREMKERGGKKHKSKRFKSPARQRKEGRKTEQKDNKIQSTKQEIFLVKPYEEKSLVSEDNVEKESNTREKKKSKPHKSESSADFLLPFDQRHHPDEERGERKENETIEDSIEEMSKRESEGMIGEIIYGVDNTSSNPPVSSFYQLKGMPPPQNKRITFGQEQNSNEVTTLTKDQSMTNGKDYEEKEYEEEYIDDVNMDQLSSPASANSKKKKKNKKNKSRNSNAQVKSNQKFRNSASDLVAANSAGTHVKYWMQRYRLFSRFDEGIQLDEVGWYSVTPESIALHQAKKCLTAKNNKHNASVVLDAYAGVGGNTIAFALQPNTLTIAIESDPTRIAMNIHNATIYGVKNRIEYILGDYASVSKRMKADIVYLAPPWGGMTYSDANLFPLSNIGGFEGGGIALYDYTKSISKNIAFSLPRNIDTNEVKSLVKNGDPLELEQNIVNSKVKMITAYFGDCAVSNTKGSITPTSMNNTPINKKINSINCQYGLSCRMDNCTYIHPQEEIRQEKDRLG